MNPSLPNVEPHCSLAETRYGTFRYFTQDDPIGKSLRLYGEWAECEVELLRSFLQEGDVVLDIGANIGTHAVPFSRAVGATGNVIAFEPQPEVCSLMEQNVTANGLGNVTVHQAVAGKSEGYAAIPRLDYSAHYNFGSVAALNDFDPDTPHLVQVPRRAVDGLSLDRCDLLKIDAEGAELDVLKGAEATLRKHRPALYLECNSIEKGLEVSQFLEDRGYRCFYCSTAAYNPDNFRQESENVFGWAHESSLLFLHEDDAWRVEVATALQLPRIERKTELVSLFTQTLRYGDAPGRPTQEYLNVLERQPQRGHQAGRLMHPVLVVVPVYNAPAYLQRLIESLASSVPEPVAGLKFFFCDDASPDPEVGRILSGPFFSRPDVEWYRHPNNLGFIGNVNAAIATAPADTDIVLLNSDTEVWEEVFSVMQAEAYADPTIATITPLSNNGTIASLFRFPVGAGMPRALSPKALARAVRQLNLDTPNEAAPTGVGFCMYMKRAAIDAIGMLDPVYGKGYGEESDWCRRAVGAGWKHLVSAKAFVLHEGTKSFDDSIKEQSIRSSNDILLQRYPDYHHVAMRYIRRDPHKFHRILVLLAALRLETAKASYLMTLHNDPDSPAGGGTEKHVRGLQRTLDAKGHIVLELFPVEDEHFCLRIHWADQRVLEERFHAKVLPDLLHMLEPFVDCLHVHHVLYWPEEGLMALAAANYYHKSVTAHDFYLLCPSINLLRLPGGISFCGVEQDMAACNACLRQQTGYAQHVMPLYRQKRLAFLRSFDTVLFPSEALLRYFERGFGPDWETLNAKAKVLGHDLEYVWSQETPAAMMPAPQPKRLVLVGALGTHKGSHLVLEALSTLKTLGYSVEILGIILPQPPGVLDGVPITPYATVEELKRLLDERRPQLVAFPSITAETFCYTFYETLILSDSAVPIVGPFGNPASIIAQEGIGVTMRSATAGALVEACEVAANNWAALHERKLAYVEQLRHEASPYYENYRALQNEIVKLVHTEMPQRPNLRLISQLDSQITELKQAGRETRAWYEAERATVAIRVALKLQGKLRAHPRLKELVLGSMRIGWKTMKKLKSLALG